MLHRVGRGIISSCLRKQFKLVILGSCSMSSLIPGVTFLAVNKDGTTHYFSLSLSLKNQLVLFSNYISNCHVKKLVKTDIQII
jgi:hypothetical protein